MWSFFCSALCLEKRRLCGKQTSPFIKNSKVIELVGDPTIWFNEPLFKKNSSPGDFSPAFGHVSPERFGQPLCLMSPIGRKASVEGGISPSDLAHSPLPPTSRSSSRVIVSSAPTAVFARTSHSPRYSFTSSASAYGGSRFLLDDAIP